MTATARRQRDGDDGNQCGAEVPEEEEQDDDDEKRAVAKRLDHVVYRQRDEVGLPEDPPVDGDPLGEAFLQPVELLVDPLRQLECIRVRLFLDRKDDGRLGVDGGGPETRLGADRNVGDVADTDGSAAREAHHRFFNVRELLNAAQAPDEDLLPALEIDTARGNGVRALGGAEHVRKRHTVGTQTIGVNQDLILLHRSSDGNDLSHARNGEKPLPNHPVGDGSYLHRRKTVARQAHEQDLTHDGSDGRENRWARAPGELGGDKLKLLAYDLARTVDVLTPVELDPDDADSLSGRRAHPPHAGGAVDRGLDGEGDEKLDLLGRHAVRFREHGHRGRGQVREDIDRDRYRRIEASGQYRGSAEKRDQAVLQRPTDDFVQHFAVF